MALLVDARIDSAKKTLREGRLLLGGIPGSVGKLRGVFVSVEAARESKLASSAPGLREPGAEAAKILAAVNKLATAQSGRQTATDLTATDASIRAQTLAALESLTKDSRLAWLAFQTKQVVPLQTAVADVQRWVEGHENRKPIVADTLAALGCEVELPETKPLPAKDGNPRQPTIATPTSGTQLSPATK